MTKPTLYQMPMSFLDAVSPNFGCFTLEELASEEYELDEYRDALIESLGAFIDSIEYNECGNGFGDHWGCEHPLDER